MGVCVIPSQPYKDQQVKLDSAVITGTINGTESQNATPAGKTYNIGYLADVTSLVQAKGAGTLSFAFSDNNHASDLDVLSGVALIVGYSDPSDAGVYRLTIFDGLDVAHGDDPAGPSQVTAPIALPHPAGFVPRTAALTIVAGGGTPAGADRIDVAGQVPVGGCLAGADGEQWDTASLPLQIPVGDTSTALSLASPPGGDELLWVAAVLRSRASGSVPASNDCPDLDGDGIVDAVDSDRDGDGVADADEAARGTSATSADSDGDGAGDAGDNCPALANPDQVNTDGRPDGGDACDADDDDDGHADGADNCALAANADQVDRDGDGLGAACDAADLAPGRCANAITGGPAAQTIAGTPFGDFIQGRGGDDGIDGGAGNDSLAGGDGDDSLTGGRGRDRLAGGAGLNSYAGGGGRDAINARNGVSERVSCGAGRDTATVDRRDRTRRCERVRRARR